MAKQSEPQVPRVLHISFHFFPFDFLLGIYQAMHWSINI